jgi:hypothetical protein
VFAALAAVVQADEQIPTGFKVGRYTRLWERNPFTEVTPGAPKSHPLPFDKLSLTSWLKDDGKFVIFVQSSDYHRAEPRQFAPHRDAPQPKPCVR